MELQTIADQVIRKPKLPYCGGEVMCMQALKQTTAFYTYGLSVNVKVNLIFYVPMVTFRMTLLMNELTNAVMDDG